MKRPGLEPKSESQSFGSADGHRRSSSPVPRSGREPKASTHDPESVSSASVAAGKPASRPDSDYTSTGVLRSEVMRNELQAWADSVITTTSCLFCEDWKHEGSAGEGREQARAHREKEHPEACIRKPRQRKRQTKRELRSAGEQEQIAVDAAHANRVRREREEAQMLEKIERGRERDRAALAALDGEAA